MRSKKTVILYLQQFLIRFEKELLSFFPDKKWQGLPLFQMQPKKIESIITNTVT